MVPGLDGGIVLLVEDNPGDARLIAESLRGAGSTLRLAAVETLAQAIAIVETERVAAVVLDLGLPDSQGLDTFVRLQAAAPEVATIIMSGDADTRVALEAVQRGAQDFLVKGHADGELLLRAVGYAIERKRAEAQLADSEEKFKYVWGRSVVPKAITDPDGRAQVNDAFAALLGYTPEEFARGVPWPQVTHPDDVRDTQLQMDALLSGEKESARFEKRYVHKDGHTVWTDVSSSLRRDAAGRPLYFMTAIVDITDRRNAEEALRRNLEVSEAVAGVSRALVAEQRTLDEVARLMLEQAMRLTASKHGYVSMVGCSGEHVMLAATEMVPGGLAPLAADPRSLTFPSPVDGVYPHLWGVSLNTGAPFLTNSPGTEPARGGTPDDHIRLDRYLSVPVITASGVVGQIAVGNSSSDYTNDDVRILERLASLYAGAIIQNEEQADLVASNESLQRMIHDVAEVMGGIIETRDPYTQGHQVRVATIANALAVEMGLGGDDLDCIQMASLLHDVGKLSIPAEILSKPGTLSEVEFALIREHPVRGHDILSRIAFPWPIADIVLQHHERCDGSGYPAGLLEADTLPAARIIAVADVLEAMASYRPYRASLGPEAAIEEITGHPEKYCADVVRAVVALYERSELGI
jgi:PAS domain S-box-containing protein/putative nucleotidyltransferase with HDIG domain